MNTKLAAAFIMALLSLMIVGSALAQTTATVGVKQGDTFKYTLITNWRSTNPNDTVPRDPNIQNQTEYFQVNVQTVTGTTVTIQTLRHYFNGIETSDTETVDVNTGQGNSTFVYAANLIRGNYLFPGNLDLPWTINETVPRFYGDSGFRQTNHVSVNRSDIEGLTFSLLDLYFDQATGIVVESHYTYATAATPQQTITQNLKLAESNVWAIAPSASPSESPSLSPSLPTQQGTTASPTQNGGAASQIDPLVLAFLVAVAVVVVVAAVVLARKRGKRPLQEPTEAQAVAAEAEVQGVLRCRKCGQENPEGSEFCNKCGSRLRK